MAGLALSCLLFLGSASTAQAADAPSSRPLPENYGHVNTKLFLGTGTNQPLIVGFGGAEGGNLFASDFARPSVEQYVAKGYAFLAVGYFGAPGAPTELDRISLDGIHDAIGVAARNPLVNGRCIALIGGSKGGELVLLLGSYYPDIKAVIGLAPGSAVFMGHTRTLDTPSFNKNDKPLTFVPVPASAVPFFIEPNRNLRRAWEEMLKDKAAVEKASIAVERINGPILLVSARRDEFWPSTEMSEAVGKRLAKNRFPFKFEHVAIDGLHDAAYSHPELAESFLDANLLTQSAAGCPRSGKN